MTPAVAPLSPIGAEIVGADVEALLAAEYTPSEIMGLLEANGVLVFRELALDDAALLTLARRFGEPVVRNTPGWSREHPGIYKIGLLPDANDDIYVRGTFCWHIDGTSLDVPYKMSLLTAHVVAASGGATQFSSTYAAYDRLSEEEKRRIEGLKVWHSPEGVTRKIDADLSPAVRERMRGERRLHPLVWTHRDGRKSLVIGETATQVEGMPEDESTALLGDLLDRATRPSRVYSHQWKVGDLVIWDNRGCLHRVEPYDEASRREMHRVTIEGDEPIV